MPIYRFEIEAGLTKQATIARIKELVGPPRSFWRGAKSFGLGDAAPPFVGKVEGDSFRVRRDIRYRNSFVPLVWGHITSVPMGSRVRVTMFIHPFIAAFMSVWFYGVGFGAVAFFKEPDAVHRWAALLPLGLLFFGVALVCMGFFPEAIKARRLLEYALSRSSV